VENVRRLYVGWLSAVTYLHHHGQDEQHAEMPWFRGEEWSYLRGGLTTLDRDFGGLVNKVHHNIETHVLHHLFPQMPHYNLVEVSEPRPCRCVSFEYLLRVSTPSRQRRRFLALTASSLLLRSPPSSRVSVSRSSFALRPPSGRVQGEMPSASPTERRRLESIKSVVGGSRASVTSDVACL